MTKRKAGIYCQWYVIEGLDICGRLVYYLIYSKQANTYAKAVKFLNDTWVKKGCKAIVLRNADFLTLATDTNGLTFMIV